MSEQLNVMHKIGDAYRKVYSYFKPITNSSSFIKNGKTNFTFFYIFNFYNVKKMKK